MLWLQPHPGKYYGQVFVVSWDAALALRDTGTDFPLLLTNQNAVSKQLEHVVVSFLQSHNLPMYVVKVSIDQQTEAAQQLGVAFVPQLRYFCRGEEVGRLTGSASYEALYQLFGVPG
jgi:hypothetical protein